MISLTLFYHMNIHTVLLYIYTVFNDNSPSCKCYHCFTHMNMIPIRSQSLGVRLAVTTRLPGYQVIHGLGMIWGIPILGCLYIYIHIYIYGHIETQ